VIKFYLCDQVGDQIGDENFIGDQVCFWSILAILTYYCNVILAKSNKK